MSGTARHVTVIVQPDGAVAGRSFRLPLWALRAGALVGTALVGFILFAAIAYAPLVRTAARVPFLERRVQRLESDNARIRELAAALDSLEARYEQVRSMVGADIVPDLAQASSLLPVAPVIRAAAADAPRLPTGPSVPRHWPLDDTSYLTRGLADTSGVEGQHEGLDIAVATGSAVRAAGGGTVLDAGEDPVFGRFVLLGHPDDYQTLYGHLSRIVTAKGRTVDPGEVIGLAGNTGRSSAPHLHFEVRQRGATVDPLALVRQEG
ncbi:MAG: M23 family metallopeptidase [Gemmatimonadales bacterium]|nr:M23 family metallopeptidase [Gemmatimonadales bacterium]